MIRFLYLLSFCVIQHLALSQSQYDYDAFNAESDFNAAYLIKEGKKLTCTIKNRGGAMFMDEDCLMFLYVNNKRVKYGTGKQISYNYNDLLIAKVRCDASCENKYYKDLNIKSMEIEINKTIFIGLTAGAGVAFILLIIAIVCGVRHCRNHYYKRLPETDDERMMDLEKPPIIEGNVGGKKEPKKKSDLDMELASEVRKKKVSESSESESDEDNVNMDGVGNVYEYNPNYNYSEMTSEI